MKIGFGNDHTGVELKNALLDHLKKAGHTCVDFGTKSAGEPLDYPEAALRVSRAIKAGEVEKGVLICGTGIGISMAANKVRGIRAAACSEPYSAKMAAMHNDAHIIALGARVVGEELAKMMVDIFFSTPYEGGRHAGRVQRMADMEEME